MLDRLFETPRPLRDGTEVHRSGALPPPVAQLPTEREETLESLQAFSQAPLPRQDVAEDVLHRRLLFRVA